MKTKLFFVVAVALFLVSSSTGDATTTADPFLVLQVQDEKKADQPEAYDINYTYDPAGRRDPFVDLLVGIKAKGPSTPKGALTVGDAKVVGITQGKEGYTAIIVGADNKARFMKAGDKLYDGQIISIEKDRVIFRQDFTEENPAAPGLRSKEVEKRLNPVQEGTQ
ncbi:hypothetical protein L0222_18805 [bacterium]|nr:hypothetical protein [bacterium]MCI0606763.1 hypothetical protein [bacterium]